MSSAIQSCRLNTLYFVAQHNTQPRHLVTYNRAVPGKHYPAYEWFITPYWMRRFGPLKLIRTSLLDRVGLHFYTLFSALNGVLAGVFTLAAVVMRKTLGASDLEIGIFNSVSVIVLLLGIVGSEMVEGRDKRPYIFWMGLISRGAFLLFLFVGTTWQFIVVAGLFFLFNAPLMPAIFSMWQANISAETRGRLWGMTAVIATLISMAAAYIAGKMLDWDPMSFRWLFATAGVLAMLGVVILTISPLRGQYKLARQAAPISLERILIQPVKSFVKLLTNDRRFLAFETAFFLYGLGLMVLFPVIPIYIVDVAQMSYEQAGIATGILSQLAVIFLVTTWGRLMDRLGPVAICIVIFTILAYVPLILLAGLHIPGVPYAAIIAVYAGYIVHGIGMSGIHVAWSMGPVMFAGNRDSSNYSGAHVTLTGLRGVIGPIAGALVKMYFGYTPVFIVSAALFILGALGMAILHHKFRVNPPNNSAGLVSS